ncbi:MAG TPA: nucleotidyltransferase domain-containing protein [Candidatus Acidoferrum sp.]|nr:nucleotidyltransferase domain-containing protein [Candidatus Acidoferrum sp.]
MKHGLAAAAVASIHQVLARHPEVERAILYGSRAKGNFKAGSDIDLTLVGEKLNSTILARIDEDLDDLLLPYEFDLSILDRITHPELLDHIHRVGVPFYQKPQATPGLGL